MRLFRHTPEIPTADEALPGRARPMPVPERHFVNGNRMVPPFPDGMEEVVFGMGCFWGAERKFWEAEGVYSTAVGYAGGLTPNPTYEEVCSGRTGHSEAVPVVYDPDRIPSEGLPRIFWGGPDPTPRIRQRKEPGS